MDNADRLVPAHDTGAPGATGSLLPVPDTETHRTALSSVTAYLGLGSNLGRRRENLTAAIDRLRAVTSITVTAVSAFYETSPIGGPAGQRDYLNAASSIETTLSPEALLAVTGGIEDAMGRRRTEPDGPRTIDIDILLYADLIRTDPELTLPHPRMHERSFVLRPLADIAPAAVHPVLHRSVSDLLAALPQPAISGRLSP